MPTSRALVAALVLASCAQSHAAFPIFPDGLDNSVVGITRADGYAFCSGVVLDHYIATAAHCVDDRSSVLVGYREDLAADENSWTRVRLARVLAVDVTRDVAIIERPDRGGTPRTLRQRPVVVDEPIVGVGHPYGLWTYTHQSGRVSHATRDALTNWPTAPFFQVDPGIHPGMSGGPIFDRHGLVVGLVSFGVHGATVDGGVPVSSVERLLSGLPAYR